MITLENYEIYFADYLDGNLPPSELREFKAFLLIHPDLDALLEEQDMPKLTAPQMKFEKKDLLKKEAIHECEDYYPIAAAEEVLTDEDKEILGKVFCSLAFRKDIDVYRNIRLKADTTIHFEKKKSLYRKKHTPVILWSMSAAAVVLVTFMLSIRSNPSLPVITETPVAANTSPVQTKVETTAEAPETVPATVVKQVTPSISINRQKQQATINRLEIATIIRTEEIPTVGLQNTPHQTINIKLIAMNSGAEIQLNEQAKEWKASIASPESRDIFTSLINAGRILTQKIKNRDFPELSMSH